MSDKIEELCDAVKNNNYNQVKKLIEQGADVNGKNEKFENTPLHYAAHIDDDSYKIIQLLLDSGADPMIRNLDDSTMFSYCDLKLKKYVKDYIKKKADPEERIGLEFLEAIEKRDINKIKNLIKQGADVNIKDENGRTALSILSDAFLRGKDGKYYKDEKALEIMQFLIQKGADINLADRRGFTPLVFACRIGVGFDAIKLLIESGADVNIGPKGTTPLFFAAERGRMNIVKYLVENGAKVNIKNSRGKMPIQSAKKIKIKNFLKGYINKS